VKTIRPKLEQCCNNLATTTEGFLVPFLWFHKSPQVDPNSYETAAKEKGDSLSLAAFAKPSLVSIFPLPVESLFIIFL